MVYAFDWDTLWNGALRDREKSEALSKTNQTAPEIANAQTKRLSELLEAEKKKTRDLEHQVRELTAQRNTLATANQIYEKQDNAGWDEVGKLRKLLDHSTKLAADRARAIWELEREIEDLRLQLNQARLRNTKG